MAIDFDETNAYNAVDRGVFLARMQQVFPGLARWLRWTYPVHSPTWVLWKGARNPSLTGGGGGIKGVR